MKYSNRKTRKSMQSMKKGKIYECCDATFDGIYAWYKKLFEKLGWMILAKKHGMVDKTATYKHSLEKLKIAITKKWKNIHDKDKKDDLGIMLENVEILIEHANKDL